MIRLRLMGRLVRVTLPGAADQWALSGTTDGALTPFALGVSPPDRDVAGVLFGAGALVELICRMNTRTGQCAQISDVRVLSDGSKSYTGEPSSMRLLVMILNYTACGYGGPGVAENTVRTRYLGPSLNGSGIIASKFNQCSYGRLTYNTSAFRVITVSPFCAPNNTRDCYWAAISGAADAAAKARIGEAAFSAFTHYTYILPARFETICGWSGLALVMGRLTWLPASTNGFWKWATVMHETLHNYGLWHSWQDGHEYGDYSTVMGNADACPTAPELSRLGWAAPAANSEGALNASTLPVGIARRWYLPATYLTGAGNHLRIRPTWLPTYGNVLQAKNLFIAVRVAKVGDAALSSSYASQVNVHEANATIDDQYPLSYFYSDPKITFVAVLPPMTWHVLPAYNLVLYAGSWTSIDRMRVYLCRYEASDAECPSLESPKAPHSASAQPSGAEQATPAAQTPAVTPAASDQVTTPPASKPTIASTVPDIISTPAASTVADAAVTPTIPIPPVAAATDTQPTINPTFTEPAINPTSSQPSINPASSQPSINPASSQPANGPASSQPILIPTHPHGKQNLLIEGRVITHHLYITLASRYRTARVC
ncbi:hypothetical protein PLESTB_001207100 [Pleodorina starrii]|uniref:Peptidase M11 gametolysin domain-containing protein n=1 Tax=Pleodorina starrii TaxID=330485 RepID=A0A9W6BS83_9CHLO|nr:hypothetical protein PLESTB_001207100 [Pleodorina starrii]